MKIINYMVCSMLLYSSLMLSMELQNSSFVKNNVPEWQAINLWQDVTPFIGRVIAYKTDSKYLAPQEGFGDLIRYGLINKEAIGQLNSKYYGFVLSRLLKLPITPTFQVVLSDSLLKYGKVRMRFLTFPEITILSQVTYLREAAFEYMTQQEALECLSKERREDLKK